MNDVLVSLSDWIKSIAKETFDKMLSLAQKSVDDGYPELMDVTTTCQFLNISYDHFNDNYRYMKGFPTEQPGKKWKKRAIIKWLETN